MSKAKPKPKPKPEPESSPPANGHSAVLDAPSPPSLPVLDTEALRRKLAGLADPSEPKSVGTGEKATVKEHASLLCLVLAELFNRDDLDPMTLWERIASGLAAGCAKVQDDDLDAFVCLCLEHVKAEPARAAAHEGLANLLGTFGTWPEETRSAFLRYIETHRYAVIVHGRARWEAFKASNAARPKGGRRDGESGTHP